MQDHHDHGSHSHAPADFGRAFAIGIALNTGFVVLEASYGVWSGSMALLADAGHNLSDVLGLLIAWGGAELSKRPPTQQFSYGLKSSSILAGLINAIILLVAVGAIVVGAIQRLVHPEPVNGGAVMAVATIGIAINGLTAWMFARGRRRDVNIKAAYFHMVADAAMSAAVVLAGGLILAFRLPWIDPAVSLIVALIILWGTFRLLRDCSRMALGAAPPGIDLAEVERALAALPGVTRVHDLHVWSMSTTEPALTAHLIMPGGCPGDELLHFAAGRMEELFHIKHTTLQIETQPDGDCRLEPCTIVSGALSSRGTGPFSDAKT
jgi:cobalt-zinc-cadmium efflux system protein